MPYVRTAPHRHVCSPPEPWGTNDDYEPMPDDWDILRDGPFMQLKQGVRLPRVGDVWECECGLTWVLRPPLEYANMVSLIPRWERESRIVRRCRKLYALLKRQGTW